MHSSKNFISTTLHYKHKFSKDKFSKLFILNGKKPHQRIKTHYIWFCPKIGLFCHFLPFLHKQNILWGDFALKKNHGFVSLHIIFTIINFKIDHMLNKFLANLTMTFHYVCRICTSYTNIGRNQHFEVNEVKKNVKRKLINTLKVWKS